MKFHYLSTLAFAAIGLSLTSTRVSAQVTYPVIHTFSGDFKSSDGNSGTYVNTVTQSSATTKSDQVVFTRSSDGETRTDLDTTTINGDGTRTVTHNDTDYGATASFTSTKTVTKEKHGQFVGMGSFTTATGVTGTLTTLESGADIVNVVSAVYSSPNGITNDLRLEEDGFGFVTVKTLNLDPAGKLTVVVTTRYITSSK